MQLFGGLDGNLSALLSAHQSIGVPQPLKLFGSPELKHKYLPRCARGEISAFALTEPNAGSDPPRLATTAEKTADGTAYVINGTNLCSTNRTLPGRPVRVHRPNDLLDGCARLRAAGGGRPGHGDGGPRRLRHPPGSGGSQGMEHRPLLDDRGRHHADPRRARVRDGEEPGRAGRAA